MFREQTLIWSATTPLKRRRQVKRIPFLQIYAHCFSHGCVFLPISLSLLFFFFYPPLSSFLAKVYPRGVLWGYLLDKPFEMHFLKNLQLFLSFFFLSTTAISQNVLKKKCERKKRRRMFETILPCLCVQFNPDRKEPRSPRRQCDADLWDCDLCRQVSRDATRSK